MQLKSRWAYWGGIIGGSLTKTKLFSVGHSQTQDYFPLATSKNGTIFRWPMAKTELYSVGPWLFNNHQTAVSWGVRGGGAPLTNHFPLAAHKNRTIFHWPLAKTKLFSVGPWLFL